MAESLTTPAILPQTIAENGDATVIPATNDQTEGKASIAYGFPPLTSTPVADGGKLVRRADMNGLFNLLSQYALFAQNGGAFTFDANVSAAIGGYPLGARLIYVDAGGKTNIVISKIPNNTYNFNSDSSYIDGLKWAYDLNLNDFARLNAENIFTKSQYIETADNTNVICFKNTNLATNNTTPTNSIVKYVRFLANDNSEVGRVGFMSFNNNMSTTDLVARRTIGGTNVICNISVNVDTNGNIWTYAPTPAAGDNSTKIATTAWVNSKIVTPVAYITEKSFNTTTGEWYRVWSDGFIEQGGRIAANTSNVTFPKPFSNTMYDIQKTNSSNSTYALQMKHTSFYNLTTTGASTGSMSETSYWVAFGI